MRIKKSIWKFPFNNKGFYFCKNKIKTLNRNITLTSSYLNKTFKCYKGNTYGKLSITRQHLGHKIGEFFLTKILGERIAYRKKTKAIIKKK